MKTEFSNDQYNLAYPDGVENHWWHLARNKILVDVLGDLQLLDAVVLEVGCGRGIVVKHLRDHGIDCTGVELGDAVPISGIGDYVHVNRNALDMPSIERQRYNTILLLDVIEHVSDPVSFIQELTDAFSNVNRFVITVPARKELWSNYDEFYGHYKRYTIDMLLNISSSLCMKSLWEGYFFHLVYPLAWLTTNLSTRNTKLIRPSGWLLFLHRLVSSIMFFDYKLFSRKMPGTSALICLSLAGR